MDGSIAILRSFFKVFQSYQDNDWLIKNKRAGPRSAVDSASDSRAGDTGFDTRYGTATFFRFPSADSRGKLSVTGKSMCT